MRIVTNPSPERWEEYKQLRLESLSDSPQSFLDDVDKTKKVAKEEWQKKLENMYFAEVDGKWVGVIGAYQDERSKLNHIVKIVSFYVSPKHRGRGIGKALLSKVIEKSKEIEGVKKLELGVITTQESAYQLYLSFGFRKVGEQKYSVKVGDKYFDEYLMELYLE